MSVKKRLLLVDDEKSVRDLVKATLENYGYRVTVAENGKQAVAFFESSGETVDLVILDIMMPEMSGPQALTALRKINPEIKAVGVTGLMLEDSDSTLRFSPDDVEGLLYKPFTGELLLTTVSDIVKKD